MKNFEEDLDLKLNRTLREISISQLCYQDAVDILSFNVSVNSAYFQNYNLLAKAWLLVGNKEQAIKNYKISKTKFNDSNENEAFKELGKLGVLE